MADILKISTPLLDRAPVTNARPVADPSVPFNLSDVTRVLQTTDPSEILQQNTGMIPDREEAPRILADLLKDPSVTVGLMKNITLLQEVIQLLPGQSAALTKEIEQLFDALLLSPEGIVDELKRQESNTTLFKGEVFDMLRGLLEQAKEKPELATNIGVLLKGLNAAMTKSDVLDSVANNLTFLQSQLKSSPRLTERLETLITMLRQPSAQKEFPALKEEIFTVLKEVQNSLLFTPQMEKTLPLIVYNLSRYNDNEDFLPDALRLLLSNMDGDVPREELLQKLQAYVDKYMPPEGTKFSRSTEDDSQVMQVLSKIIGRQADSEELQLLSGDKLEKIVHSLLSSPSNFTPLLHFIIPVQDQDLRAFAEIWIDPNAEEEQRRGGVGGDATHMLLVFDVEGIGRFEAELFVQGQRIAMNLLCPPAYVDAFNGIGGTIRNAVQSTGYSFESINVDRLERTHSLMQVFTDLPHKRTGIDVRI